MFPLLDVKCKYVTFYVSGDDGGFYSTKRADEAPDMVKHYRSLGMAVEYV